MLHKTKGIVLQHYDYSESSMIVRIFTEDFGLQSYLVNSSKSRRGKFRAAVFEPLTLAELVVYKKDGRGLQRISEIRANPQYASIPFDMARSSILIFLQELLCKTIREENPDPDLFEFLFHGLQILDVSKEAIPHFHLYFMIQMARYLGFRPDGSATEETPFFDMKEGAFTKTTTDPAYTMDREESSWTSSMLACTFEDMAAVNVPSGIRTGLLNKLILFYRLHLDGFTEMQSHKVLREILR
jgi:DNA repair protein RecO (recombination protein O)